MPTSDAFGGLSITMRDDETLHIGEVSIRLKAVRNGKKPRAIVVIDGPREIPVYRTRHNEPAAQDQEDSST